MRRSVGDGCLNPRLNPHEKNARNASFDADAHTSTRRESEARTNEVERERRDAREGLIRSRDYGRRGSIHPGRARA